MAGAEAIRTDASLSDPTLATGLEIIAARALGDRDEAREAVQETLARALEALRQGRIPSDAPLAAFVYGIARHVIADVHRRRKRLATAAALTHLPSSETSALEQVINAEDATRMERALALLPQGDRELLEWCYLHGEKLSDIATRLGEPAQRVRKRKSRALEKLREITRPGGVGASHPSPGNDF